MSDFKINRISNIKGDFGPVIAGVSTVNSTGCMTLPRGSTVDRLRGRGLMMGGGGNPGSQFAGNVNTIDFIEIATTGNAVDFGDLTYSPIFGSNGGVFSTTRGISAGGFAPSSTNVINFVTIAFQSNAQDFGDLSNMKSGTAALSNQTRGIFAGGDPMGGGYVNNIDFITISTLGNSTTYGDLSTTRRYSIGTASPTRGIIAGGSSPAMSPFKTKLIEFVTIATLGNAVNFGNLTTRGDQIGVNSAFGVSNGTRGVIAGGATEPNNEGISNVIDFINIASTGDATDFGDLSVGRGQGASMSNKIRGVFGRGESGVSPRAQTNVIDFVNIATTGNATDFGDSTEAKYAGGGGSDSHGGISE